MKRFFSNILQLVDIIRCKISVEYFAREERIFQILLQQWFNLKNAVKVLSIFYKATKEIQRVNYTLSDFFGSLIVLREKLLKFTEIMRASTNLPQHLYDELIKRWPLLVKNPMMICAIYLDRRFSSEMSEYEVELAKLTLLKIWKQIKNSVNNTELEQIDNIENVQLEDESSVLENYFCNKGINTTISGKKNHEPDYRVSDDQLLIILNEFDKIGRLPAKTSILEFWESQKENFPEVYILSTVINAIAPSQTRTERDFSALGLIYNDRRQRLTLSNLQDIMLMKLNPKLTLHIFEEDIIELTNEEEI